MTIVAPKRSEIPVEYTWDVASIFATVADWETAVTQLDTHIEQVSQYKGRLHEGPAVLADCLAQAEQLEQQARKIFTYAGLNYNVDSGSAELAARNDQARGVLARAFAAMAFIKPELIAVGLAQVKTWLAQEKQLAHYEHFLDSLRKQQAHVRSAEVEQLLSLSRDAFSTATATHGILANTDMPFAPAQGSDGQSYDITQGTIGALITHADHEVRRTAWQHYADAHLTYKNTMANVLAAGVKQNVFFSRARGYSSALEAALSPNFIPTEVFHNLINTFRQNLPTWHRYWRIRRQALGYDELHEYDVKAPLTADPPKLSYETAVDWIAQGMAPLGKEYVSILRDGALEQRWVDVFPNQGKRMGAFSSGLPGTHPFIMMSFSDDLFGLSTLAHELGHSLHSYFTWQTQPFVYTNYGLFVAEVASNFNQALVRAHLFESNDAPNFHIAVIEEAMSNFHRYFFIMPTLARFELELHQRVERGQPLNADIMNNLLADFFQEGYGDELVFDRERTGITWAQFHTHLYSNFYVYQYATGISAAHALAHDILQEKPGAVDNYLAFLKAGSSMYPMDALKLAGVDMTSPEPVETAFAVLAQIVDRLEQLVG